MCYDVIFKSVFQEYPNILGKMISDITGIDYKILKDNIILEVNELPITRHNEKFKKCDFIIRIDNNKVINLELNKESYAGLLVKNLSYAFNLYSSFTKKGIKYDDNLMIMQINIDCFKQETKKALSKYYLREEDMSDILDRSFSICRINVVKCSELYYNDTNKETNKYISWGAFLYCNDLKNIPNILKDVLEEKEIRLIMDKLNKITQDDYFMTKEESLEWGDWIERSVYDEGVEHGRTEGIEKSKRDIIKSMLKNNMDILTISKITNKSISEIEALKNEL